MSTMRAYVSVQSVKNVAGLKDYLELGRGPMKRAHQAGGTNRYAAMYCDAPSPDVFVTQARQLAREHSRRNEAYSLIVSPPDGTYAKDDPSAMELMVADVVEGGRRAYPASKLFAVAHADSEGSHGCGGKAHVHLVVMNHDLASGKAISANRTAPQVRTIYNTLGAELGWDETEVTHERTLHKSALYSTPAVVDTSKDDDELAATRGRLAALGAYELELFDDVVKAKQAATGKTYAEWRKSFQAELRKDGITMEFAFGRRGPHQPKAPASKAAQGVIYRRRNPTTNRMRGMKASDLGPQVSVGALRQASKDDILDQRRQAQAEAAKAAAAERARQAEADRRVAAAEAARQAAEAKREPVLWWYDGDPLVYRNGTGNYYDTNDVKLDFVRTPSADERYSWDLRTRTVDADPDYLKHLEDRIDLAAGDGLFTAERAREVADEMDAYRAEQEAQEQAERERQRQAQAQREQAAADRLKEEQRRAANPTLFGATIDGITWNEAQAWEQRHRDEANSLADKIKADPNHADTEKLRNTRRRLVKKVNDANAVFHTVYEQTSSQEQARQATMRHVAHERALEVQKREQFQREMDARQREWDVRDARDTGRGFGD